MKQTNLQLLKFGFPRTLLGSLAMTLALTLVLALVLAAVSSSLATSAFAAGEPRKQQTRGAYRSEIDALISENGVPCKVAADCDAVPLGVKACGGPLEFLILSKATKSKISDGLTDLTKTINEMDTLANAQSGAMGTCQAMIKPELTCSAGNCVKAAAKK